MIGRGPSRTEKRFKSLTRLLAEELKEAILTGKLKPGERLSEEKLTELLKVSRVPLREAFRRLEVEGYITFLSYNQAIVSKPSVEDIQDSYFGSSEKIDMVFEGTESYFLKASSNQLADWVLNYPVAVEKTNTQARV